MNILIPFIFLVVTAYMTVATMEDYRICQVSRWKHLIGFVPEVVWLCLNPCRLILMDYVSILLFVFLFLLFGGIGIYGLADGMVLANLTLLFGGIGGTAGIGAVILVLIVASASMLICHVLKSLINREKIFRNAKGAFLPHLMTGYMIVIVCFIVSLRGVVTI